MGKVTGFKEFNREVEPYRSPKKRVLDFKEIYTDHDESLLNTQASRCMNCGVPFCHSTSHGCPLGNIIPKFNDLVFQDNWKEALKTLLQVTFLDYTKFRLSKYLSNVDFFFNNHIFMIYLG